MQDQVRIEQEKKEASKLKKERRLQGTNGNYRAVMSL